MCASRGRVSHCPISDFELSSNAFVDVKELIASTLVSVSEEGANLVSYAQDSAQN